MQILLSSKTNVGPLHGDTAMEYGDPNFPNNMQMFVYRWTFTICHLDLDRLTSNACYMLQIVL